MCMDMTSEHSLLKSGETGKFLEDSGTRARRRARLHAAIRLQWVLATARARGRSNDLDVRARAA
eukprot:1869926-Pyramimonas_sp.AAC.2